MKPREIKLFWTDPQEAPAPFHYKNKASFYASTPWIRLKTYKLTINPLCERCKKKDLIVPAEEVHHIEEISKAPELALEITNLESLCKKCHSKESYKYLQEARKPKKGHIINIKNKLKK